MPAVQNLVPAVNERKPGLLKATPVFKHLHILISLAGRRYLVTEQPHSPVKFPYLIPVMVVRSLTASVSETLVYGMVHYVYDLLDIRRIAGIGIILCIIVNHLSDEPYSHLPQGIVELVIAQQRGAYDRSVRKPVDIIFGIGVIRPFEQGALHVILAGISRLDGLVKPLFHQLQHLHLLIRNRRGFKLRILLPLPQTAPVPHIALEVVIVFRNLLVRRDLVMELFSGESQPVYIYGTLRHSRRRHYCHPGDVRSPLFRLFIPVMPVR